MPFVVLQPQFRLSVLLLLSHWFTRVLLPSSHLPSGDGITWDCTFIRKDPMAIWFFFFFYSKPYQKLHCCDQRRTKKKKILLLQSFDEEKKQKWHQYTHTHFCAVDISSASHGNNHKWFIVWGSAIISSCFFSPSDCRPHRHQPTSPCDCRAVDSLDYCTVLLDSIVVKPKQRNRETFVHLLDWKCCTNTTASFDQWDVRMDGRPRRTPELKVPAY